jgi:hypothetical protein
MRSERWFGVLALCGLAVGARAEDVVTKTAQPLVTLWESTEAQEDCAKENSELVVAAAGRVPLSSLPEPEVCREATVAKLTRGTRVKVLPTSEQCGPMKTVEVVSGRHTGKTGCIGGAGALAEK